MSSATKIQLLGDDDEVAEMPQLDVSVPNAINQTRSTSGTQYSCISHLFHCQLNCYNPERKLKFDQDHLACALPSHRPFSTAAARKTTGSVGGSNPQWLTMRSGGHCP